MAGDGLRQTMEAGVLTLTMDRPAVHNALDHGMAEALRVAVAGCAGDGGVRVIVIAAAGRHFSAGVDLERLAALHTRPRDESVADARMIADMLETVYASPKPVVAAVQGAAFGGALALVAACDIVVAASVARFGAGEARIGLTPVLLTPYLVAAVGLRAARHLLLTCERIDAREAHRIGLVQRVTEPDQLVAATAEIVGQVMLGGPGSLAATKAILEAGAPVPLDGAARQAAAVAIAGFRATAEAAEGIAAFLGKRAPGWTRHGASLNSSRTGEAT